MLLMPPRGVTIPPGTTCFTTQLAGATLAELLEHADRNWWPSNELATEWSLLRNWALQTESLTLDEAENVAWEEQMRNLVRRELPYADYTAERLAALAYRTRTRKLAQANLRYKYGYRGARPARLIHRAVRDYFREWSST